MVREVGLLAIQLAYLPSKGVCFALLDSVGSRTSIIFDQVYSGLNDSPPIHRDNLWPVRPLSSIDARGILPSLGISVRTHSPSCPRGSAISQIVTGLILPPTVNEFNFRPPWLKLGQNIGLLIGAAFWGVGADIWGRK